MTTCPACDHQFRVSDRQTLAVEDENAQLRAQLELLQQWNHDKAVKIELLLEIVEKIGKV
tara:strand:- start:1574 stop:1753 length:180 start_codon:yes stop_codon:yes gene_type:complete